MTPVPLSRIAGCFASLRASGRKALIPYFAAGDPGPEYTVPLMHAMVRAGADVIELGVPFSDPMADGPVNQRASERALRAGMTLRKVIEAVAQFRRQDPRTPVVLMGYGNPIEAMGYELFASRAGAAGVDGVLVVDYPPEESQPLTTLLRGQGIDSIFLLSPTTDDARMEAVSKVASGYIYYVSLKGVTGAANLDVKEVGERTAKIRSYVNLPIGVGFGIRDPQTARAVAAVADAVVVGSRIVQEIENRPAADVVGSVEELLAGFRKAMDD